MDTANPVVEFQDPFIIDGFSPFVVLKLRIHDAVVRIQLLMSEVWAFLVNLGYLEFDSKTLAIRILKPILGPVVRAGYRSYKFLEQNKPVWEKNIKTRMRSLELNWKKFKIWFVNIFTFGNAMRILGKLLDFAKVWKPMPGMLLSSKLPRVHADKKPGYVHVKFRWREQDWKARLGINVDPDNPWHLVNGRSLFAEFELESDGSLDMNKVAHGFYADELVVLHPGRIEPYPLDESKRISSIGIHMLTARDNFITVVEHDDSLTHARKVFHQWLRGSLSYCLLRWIVFLAIVGSVVGAVGHLACNFYATYMNEKYGFEWTPWPSRRARGWVEPKYQRYL